MSSTNYSNTQELIEGLIKSTKSSLAVSTLQAPTQESAGGWWKENFYKVEDLDKLSSQLLSLAFESPNFSAAFVVAYQFALRSMFPLLTQGSDLACLCVSEKAGNSPKAIETYLKNQKVSGEKTFVTCAQDIDTLLVMLDDQGSTDSQDSKNTEKQKKSLRLLQINHVKEQDTGCLSLSLSPYNADKFLPDIDKGVLTLKDFSALNAVLLEGDAHESYSKPFSVLEGLCIRLAMCSHLLKWACIYQWPKTLQADLILQIVALQSVLDASPQSATTQIVMDAQNRILEGLVKEIDLLAENNPLFKPHWQRDKISLYMDFRLRAARLEKAWFELSVDANVGAKT